MDKVMVQLDIPVTGNSYDVLLPRVLSVFQITELAASFLMELESGAYMPDENVVLCDRESGKIYDINASVESLHLKNGARLMLI